MICKHCLYLHNKANNFSKHFVKKKKRFFKHGSQQFRFLLFLKFFLFKPKQHTYIIVNIQNAACICLDCWSTFKDISFFGIKCALWKIFLCLHQSFLPCFFITVRFHESCTSFSFCIFYNVYNLLLLVLYNLFNSPRA